MPLGPFTPLSHTVMLPRPTLSAHSLCDDSNYTVCLFCNYIQHNVCNLHKERTVPWGGGGARDRRFPLHHLCWGGFRRRRRGCDLISDSMWREIKEMGTFDPRGSGGSDRRPSRRVFVNVWKRPEPGIRGSISSQAAFCFLSLTWNIRRVLPHFSRLSSHQGGVPINTLTGNFRRFVAGNPVWCRQH